MEKAKPHPSTVMVMRRHSRRPSISAARFPPTLASDLLGQHADGMLLDPKSPLPADPMPSGNRQPGSGGARAASAAVAPELTKRPTGITFSMRALDGLAKDGRAPMLPIPDRSRQPRRVGTQASP